MRRIVFQVLLLVLSCVNEAGWAIFQGTHETVRELRTLGSHLQQQRECKQNRTTLSRPHSVTITEFGAVGDGVTDNTIAFHNAIFYLNTFADKGGAQLFVPAGKWLTGSFNLTSHLTLYLDIGAVILGSQVILWGTPSAIGLPISYGSKLFDEWSVQNWEMSNGQRMVFANRYRVQSTWSHHWHTQCRSQYLWQTATP